MNHVKKTTGQTDTAVFTMASRSVTSGYADIWCSAPKMHLITCAGIQKRWAPRIYLLLDIAVEKLDKYSPNLQKMC